MSVQPLSNLNLAAPRLSQVAAVLHAPLLGGDREFRGVNSDSRTIQTDELFVALQGPSFNAEDFLHEVAGKGAAGAVVARSHGDLALSQICVADTGLALQDLASAWRAQFSQPLIGLTGSNGKTTVKEILAAILQQTGPGWFTPGNRNNEIGVPLTLLQLRPEHRWAVIEMGANHPREIARLTALARPDVAILNNAGPAHLEGFGSLQGVASAKAEIFTGLRPGGTAVLNLDDVFARQWLDATQGMRRITFGHTAQANVRVLDSAPGTICLATTVGELEVPFALLGEHNRMNAAAAVAGVLALDVPLAAIAAGLTQVSAVAGRLQLCLGKRGERILDDTYNANPASMRAGIEVLREFSAPRYLVLGDMGELGADALSLHQEIGQAAAVAKLEGLFALGPLAKAAADAFGVGAQSFVALEDLLTALHALPEDAVLLVKGSRSAHMERVVQALRDATEMEGAR